MIDDKIINFITDNYKEYNDSFNINDYSNEQLFTDVHTIELYKVFDNIKTYIIKYYVLSDNTANIPIYFTKKSLLTSVVFLKPFCEQYVINCDTSRKYASSVFFEHFLVVDKYSLNCSKKSLFIIAHHLIIKNQKNVKTVNLKLHQPLRLQKKQPQIL